jgi:hypothetical protein
MYLIGGGLSIAGDQIKKLDLNKSMPWGVYKIDVRSVLKFINGWERKIELLL